MYQTITVAVPEERLADFHLFMAKLSSPPSPDATPESEPKSIEPWTTGADQSILAGIWMQFKPLAREIYKILADSPNQPHSLAALAKTLNLSSHHMVAGCLSHPCTLARNEGRPSLHLKDEATKEIYVTDEMAQMLRTVIAQAASVR